MKRIILTAFATLFLLMSHAQNGVYAGGDISMLPEYEGSSTKYLDAQGNVIPDLIPWLISDCGWNTFRVRLFVNPDKTKKGTGVVQDIDYVKALGRRIKAAGANLILDFHYSDTWADPSNQKLPAAWSACVTAQQKADKIYAYTKECLEAMKAEGATPDLVQVGNETTYGMAGIKVHPYDYSGDDWDGMLAALKAGCRAVRECTPQAKIIIHTERSENVTQTCYYYNKIKDVDYDVIGLSYYPFFHGSLTLLKATLSRLATDFPGKKVHIVETAYPIQWWPDDAKYDTRSMWPVEEGKCDGQFAFMKDLIATLAAYPQVDGLNWWFPEEAGNGDAANWTTMEGVVISSWLNRGMWWPTVSNGGHWPLTTSEGGILWEMKKFLNPQTTGIGILKTTEGSTAVYNLKGQYVGTDTDALPKGIYIRNNKKLTIQ